jgi:hypothetical protein
MCVGDIRGRLLSRHERVQAKSARARSELLDAVDDGLRG